MPKKITTYFCTRCGHGQANDFETCPACGWNDKLMKKMWDTKGWFGTGKSQERKFDQKRFENWLESQEEPYVHRVWKDGYSEGRMQEKHDIVDFPELIARKPEIPEDFGK